MKFVIDNADIHEIKRLYAIYPVDGVTTNPSILAASGKHPFACLREIREFIGGDMLHVQVLSQKAEDMLEEAHRIQAELGKATYIKIPVVEEGLRAVRMLKAEDANVTATAVYTHMQAYMAAKAGADYVAPYINRIDSMGFNGIRTAAEIHDILKNNGFHTEVLAASFKNTQQILELCLHGIGACTVSPEVMGKLIVNDSVSAAIDVFTKDFQRQYGENQTMKDCG